MLTLSAPAFNRFLMSSSVLTPPPTVNGMKTFAAVRSTTSIIVFRFSWDAVMSRKQSSSAPSRSYTVATSTGSPASRRLTKLTPLTTRPSFTSRQGMMRLVNMLSSAFMKGRDRSPISELAVVEGLADNHAFDTWPKRLHGFQILHTRNSSGCNHRKRRIFHDFLQSRQIRSTQHAVPRNVGIDHRANRVTG